MNEEFYKPWFVCYSTKKLYDFTPGKRYMPPFFYYPLDELSLNIGSGIWNDHNAT